MHRGFADRSLTAWVWRRAIKRMRLIVHIVYVFSVHLSSIKTVLCV